LGKLNEKHIQITLKKKKKKKKIILGIGQLDIFFFISETKLESDIARQVMPYNTIVF
jgi:hypothetical protein